MLIKEIMSKKPEFVSPSTPLKKVAEEMTKHDCGFIPVGESDRLVGVITDRDLALRAIAKSKDPDKTQAKEVMTQKVLYCYEEDDIKKATESMGKQQIRRLIVLNNDKDKRMTGVVSLGDIARKCKDDKLCGHTFQEIEKETQH
jgi:CBS domain-containing protein